MTAPVLPQGIGLFFSAFMVALTWIQSRYTPYTPSNTEEFSSASRSVKSGLIASGIVSAWTWAATLLQSSAVAYKYGISGPYWYGSGATIQVLLFAMLSAKIKMNAPQAHTWLEIVNARWGRTSHLVFMFFGLATNIIVSSMLALGGAATVTALTGMSTVAACFLIPLGVSIYVIVGGMRATLLCDYTHTTVLFAIILTFVFTVYATSPKIGSFHKMHDLLVVASKATPVPGNAGGSYLTMRSKNGLIFGVINIIGNFGINDQAYYQRAIASKGTTTVKAFLMGGLAWFAIPFTFATTLDVSAGLPAPSAAAALLGKSGASIMLVLLFLAVTSATSAELIAVSSILTYDVYKRYYNPRATEHDILRVSQYGRMLRFQVLAYAVFMGLAGLVFFYIGVSLGWLYMGVLLGSAVVPIALCITWKKANKWGCIVGAVLGLALAIMSWLVATSTLNHGKIDVATSGGDYEMLTGNLVAIAVGGIVSLGWSLYSPENFDFEVTRRINTDRIQESDNDSRSVHEDDEKKSPVEPILRELSEYMDPIELKKAFRFAAIAPFFCSNDVINRSTDSQSVISIFVFPLPLFFASTIFGVRGLSAWVTIGIIWVFCSILTVVFLPLIESREALSQITRGIIKDLFAPGSGKYVHHHQMTHGDERNRV
ncbi:hypothetical protein BS47DRAFT_1370822 [Hydnum rufescens UP504]|uniref:Urea transporter n=1 Tax=Hydnum rufescens UP504 TaxID=1448309 RepID=A0A9P6B946_9AGAM|nr:hypothetical protein BS47DRAFT_1370822 [Hydnum rufescens UP504]